MTKRILFVCGSMNQTTQMHQIARCLTEYKQAFTPHFADGLLEFLRRRDRLEFTILGNRITSRCREYLRAESLLIDERGRGGLEKPYDLVVTCTDVIVQKSIRRSRLILVQEGITDPEDRHFRLVQRCRWLPRWIAGTAATGLSDKYVRFCVASEGYRDLFIGKGARPEKIVVTGIPNFDNCERYRCNTFAHRSYVLVCTSPLREILRGEDRVAFIRRAVTIAAGRPMIFKFHPSENFARASAEVQQHAPGSLIFTRGSAEEMIANCDVLITRFSSTVFVGLALGKETYSDFPMQEMRRLLPVQNNAAAQNIAAVCRQVIESGEQGVPA